MDQEPDPDLDARLAALEPPYRSRGEAQVGRLLDRYGLPFFYEQPLLVLDRGRYRMWHPDFTLPSYNGLVVEYADMPEKPEYMRGIGRKECVYRCQRHSRSVRLSGGSGGPGLAGEALRPD